MHIHLYICFSYIIENKITSKIQLKKNNTCIARILTISRYAIYLALDVGHLKSTIMLNGLENNWVLCKFIRLLILLIIHYFNRYWCICHFESIVNMKREILI